MHSPPPLDIKAVVVCDDVRREENGKGILIGVYSTDILLKEMPVDISLNFWLITYAVSAGQKEFKIRIDDITGAQIAAANVVVMVTDDDSDSAIRLGPMLVQIKTAGEIYLKVKFAGGKWRTIKRILVKLMA